MAAEAERESVKLKKLEYFQNLLHERAGDGEEGPTTFPATVVDVRNYGLLVELPDIVLSGLVHVSTLDDDFYQFDPVRLRFTGSAPMDFTSQPSTGFSVHSLFTVKRTSTSMM